LLMTGVCGRVWMAMCARRPDADGFLKQNRPRIYSPALSAGEWERAKTITVGCGFTTTDLACRTLPLTAGCGDLARKMVLPENGFIVSLKIMKAIGGWGWMPVAWRVSASDGFRLLARAGRFYRHRPSPFSRRLMALFGLARWAMVWCGGRREFLPT